MRTKIGREPSPQSGQPSHMVEARLTPPNSFMVAIPSTSLNRVYLSSYLAVLGSGRSINLRRSVWRMP